MKRCRDSDNDREIEGNRPSSTSIVDGKSHEIPTRTCSSCGHLIQYQDKGAIQDLPGLPAGVKFDPTDKELLEHLEGKVSSDSHKLHPLIDEFIRTLEGENGICCTHPERLPGVSKDGLIRHFFHCPSKAYTTGTRKRRKVHIDEHGEETRWHKTGKTRPVVVNGKVKGFKKILVLYTNYGKQRKPEKTNWVMHQYHLGSQEEERDGELVVSKVFYQTQPRHYGAAKDLTIARLRDYSHSPSPSDTPTDMVHYYESSSLVPYDPDNQHQVSPSHLITNFTLQVDASCFLA